MVEIKEIKNYNDITNILLSALNDWPHAVKDLADFESQIHKFINRETSIVNIKNSMKRIDFTKNSWEAESLTQLLELFEYYTDCDNLKSVFRKFEQSLFS